MCIEIRCGCNGGGAVNAKEYVSVVVLIAVRCSVSGVLCLVRWGVGVSVAGLRSNKRMLGWMVGSATQTHTACLRLFSLLYVYN